MANRYGLDEIKEDDLRRLFCQEEKTMAQIATIYKCSEWRIWNHVKKYNLKKPYREPHNILSMPFKNELEDLYASMTFIDIAKKYNVSNVTVKNWFLKHKIPLRSHSMTIKKFALPKIEKTCLEKYGVSSVRKANQTKDKIAATKLRKYGTTMPLRTKENYKRTEEYELLSYCNSFGYNFTTTRINGKEYDGYDPGAKIAIEYCGLYWHNEQSNLPKPSSYHYSKYKDCVENNIRLFTIFSDEWIHRKEQLKGLLAAILDKSRLSIYARNTEVREIPKQQAIDFCETYHLQGNPHQISHAVGIFDGLQLLGVMTFRQHHRQNNDGSIVLNRLTFANKKVIGGASKMLSFAIRTWGFPKITTWSDNRWASGKVYEAMGFTLEKVYPPSYDYVNYKYPDKRIPKQSCQKKKLNCKPGQTEKEKALELGLARIWDCGKKKWVRKIHGN